MSIWKKFTVACGGFALLSAAFYLFCQWMAFAVMHADISKLQALKPFFNGEGIRDFRPYLWLLAVLSVSLAVSVIGKRFPAFCFVCSVLPMLTVSVMLELGCLYERPMLYVALCAVYALGSLWECVRLDREDGRRRGACGVCMTAVLAAAVSTALFLCPRWLAGASTAQAGQLKQALLTAVQAEADFSAFLSMAVLWGVSALLGWLLLDLHFVHAAVAVGGWFAVLVLLGKEAFPCCGALMAVSATVILIGRVVVMLSCAPCEEQAKPSKQHGFWRLFSNLKNKMRKN